ncbi:hypothetical protein [Parvularcula lutaonensis]|uniref:Uncharacterized protein n=1 Tax=Parvularcula lutaonensis TaxID=491923 RepID=A0ABV7MDD4_9PROT|nr:hypothetical protein [Parvularcula lutaonensis]
MIRSILVTSVVPAALLVAAAYQALMGLNGPDGLKRAEQLAEVRAEQAMVVAGLMVEQARLEERADRLELESLDEDLLEESVRANLGHMRPGEYRIAVGELDAVAAIEVSHEAELTNLIAVALLENQGA